MPCVVEVPQISFDKHLQLMLCMACKKLSREDLISIRPNTGYVGLFSWYARHLFEDYNNNLGHGNEDELKLIKEELDRMGIVLLQDESGKFNGFQY